MKFIKLGYKEFEEIIVDNFHVESSDVEDAVKSVLSTHNEIRWIKDDLSFQKYDDIAKLVVCVTSIVLQNKSASNEEETIMAENKSQVTEEQKTQKKGKAKKVIITTLKLVGLVGGGFAGGYFAANFLGKKRGK